MKVYRFESGETEWTAAESFEQAKKFMEEQHDWVGEDSDITELSSDEMHTTKMMWHDEDADEMSGEKISMAEALSRLAPTEPMLIAATWLY